MRDSPLGVLSGPQIKKAFFALVANGIRAAPLWDSKKQSFVGEEGLGGRGKREIFEGIPGLSSDTPRVRADPWREPSRGLAWGNIRSRPRGGQLGDPMSGGGLTS